MAGINFSKQFSLAGNAAQISEAERAAKALKIACWTLPADFVFIHLR